MRTGAKLGRQLKVDAATEPLPLSLCRHSFWRLLGLRPTVQGSGFKHRTQGLGEAGCCFSNSCKPRRSLLPEPRYESKGFLKSGAALLRFLILSGSYHNTCHKALCDIFTRLITRRHFSTSLPLRRLVLVLSQDGEV